MSPNFLTSEEAKLVFDNVPTYVWRSYCFGSGDIAVIGNLRLVSTLHTSKRPFLYEAFIDVFTSKLDAEGRKLFYCEGEEAKSIWNGLLERKNRSYGEKNKETFQYLRDSGLPKDLVAKILGQMSVKSLKEISLVFDDLSGHKSSKGGR